MKHRNLLLMAFFAALTLGCGSPESKLVGTYSGPANQNLVLKADKTFTIGAGESSMGGKWAMEEKKVTLQVETIGGKPREQATNDAIAQFSKVPGVTKAQIDQAKQQAKQLDDKVMATVSEDGKTFSMMNNLTNQTITFTKQGS